MERISLDSLFMEAAILFSRRSTCARVQVGAVLVKQGRIISTGFNGVGSDQKHCVDYFKQIYQNRNRKKMIKIPGIDFEGWILTVEFKEMHSDYSKFEIHAEENCIAFAARNGISTEGSILYTTISPCLPCAKLIVQAGVNDIRFLKEYDRDDGAMKYLELSKEVKSISKIYV